MTFEFRSYSVEKGGLNHALSTGQEIIQSHAPGVVQALQLHPQPTPAAITPPAQPGGIEGEASEVLHSRGYPSPLGTVLPLGNATLQWTDGRQAAQGSPRPELLSDVPFEPLLDGQGSQGGGQTPGGDNLLRYRIVGGAAGGGAEVCVELGSEAVGLAWLQRPGEMRNSGRMLQVR